MKAPAPIVFNRNHSVRHGELETLTPELRRMTAPNPGAFTFHGTGTYVLGRGRVAVIDPGPAIVTHIDALLAALGQERITHILVTHTHMDHSPGCRLLQSRVDAPVYAYQLGASAASDSGEAAEAGIDLEFRADVALADGDWVYGEDWCLQAVYTPGHLFDHLCFADPERQALFSGDHVMGWSTSIVSPPGGNMGEYIGSLHRLLERSDAIYWPTHGAAIEAPKPLVQSLIEHRNYRAHQILVAVAGGLQTVVELVPPIYHHLDPGLWPAAERSVLATVLHLLEQQKLVRVSAPGELLRVQLG